MLIIECTFVAIDLTNNVVNLNPYPYDGNSTRIIFSLLMYKYGWYVGFKSTCINILANLLCLPLDLIKFVLTLPMCFIYNSVQCIWNSPSIFYYLGFQTLTRFDNWLAPPPPPPTNLSPQV